MKDENKWVRLESARAVLEIGAWNAVPVLLQGLNDPDLQTRSLCAEILEQKVGENFGYDPKASESERAASILQWNRWWEEKKGDPSVEGNLVSR